jgi:hypothetical protein
MLRTISRSGCASRFEILHLVMFLVNVGLYLWDAKILLMSR